MRAAVFCAVVSGCGQPSQPATAFPGMTAFPAMTPFPAMTATPFPTTSAPIQARDLASALLTPADVAPDCQPTTVEAGSLHANVLYQVSAMPQPTGGKVKQNFLCAGAAVAVFFFAFGSDAEAISAAGIAGAQLWGGSGPSTEHPDEVLRSGPVLAVVSAQMPAPMVAVLSARRGFALERDGSVPASGPADVEPATLAALRAALDCAGAEERWCLALDRFGAGSPATPWHAPILGGSLHVVRGRLGAAPAAVNAEEVSYLIVRPDGVRYGEVTPSSPQETVQLQAVLGMIRNSTPVPPSDPVFQYVQSLASGTVAHATVVGRSLVYHPTNTVLIRDAGSDFVVLEVADAATTHAPFYVGIFPKR
jgi:hypothetical protein